jgi:hypothetical protein
VSDRIASKKLTAADIFIIAEEAGVVFYLHGGKVYCYSGTDRRLPVALRNLVEPYMPEMRKLLAETGRDVSRRLALIANGQ